MFHIAAGVCLGILAAVLILNWWQAHLVRREERRERKALLRAERQAAQEYAEWLRAYEAASHVPEPVTVKPVREISDAVVSGAFWAVIALWVLSITAASLTGLVMLPH